MMTKKLFATIALISLAACSSDGGKKTNSSSSNAANSSSSVASAALDLDNIRLVLNTNADIALAAYNDSVDTAIALQTALATFAETPNQANLDAAKRAWLVAREPYGQTEVYRFRLSPIDSTDYASEDGLEGDINAWPLGEGLIDYVVEGNDFGADQVGVSEHSTGVDYPSTNIIQSDVEINADLISNTATAEDEHDVIAGYHAIEFLLWGQDLNINEGADSQDVRDQLVPTATPSSGGNRPLSDFQAENPYAARRHQFMQVVAEKLVSDLQSVRDGWLEGASYRQAFTTVETQEQAREKLGEILIGMGTLSQGELAGERMQIAFSSGSQEDEHSCFSDNTHRDIWLNAEGVANSYYGVYGGYDSDLDGIDDVVDRAISAEQGYGIDDYLAEANLASVASLMDEALQETAIAYTAIDASARAGTPVDVLIQTEMRNAQNPMYTAILALNNQTITLGSVGAALGIESVSEADTTACDTTQPDQSCD